MSDEIVDLSDVKLFGDSEKKGFQIYVKVSPSNFYNHRKIQETDTLNIDHYKKYRCENLEPNVNATHKVLLRCDWTTYIYPRNVDPRKLWLLFVGIRGCIFELNSVMHISKSISEMHCEIARINNTICYFVNFDKLFIIYSSLVFRISFYNAYSTCAQCKNFRDQLL